MNDTQTHEIAFSDKFKNATDLIEVASTAIVTNAQEHAVAGQLVNTIRSTEKALDDEYKAHPVIVEAKKLQAIKGDLAARLETARKQAKRVMMLWEDAEEAKRRAEEVKRQEEARKQAEEEALAAAIAAEQAGAKEEAEAIIAAPIITPVVVIPKSVPKVEGHSRRMVPKFRIVNEALIPRIYLMPDTVKIGGVIRSLKSAANIAGVEFYEEAA